MNVFLYTLFIVKVAKIILHHLWKWQEEVWSLQRGRGDAEKESFNSTAERTKAVS